MNYCIPSKTNKGKSSLPWITQDVRRTARWRNKMYRSNIYRQYRLSSKTQDRKRYLDLRHGCRKKIQQSYEKYLSGIIYIDQGAQITPRPVNSKKLFSFLKDSRQDNQGFYVYIKKKLGNWHLRERNVRNRQFQSVFTPKSPLSLSQLCEMKVNDFTANWN